VKPDVVKFFRVQRGIFGICPHSGEFFRLSDCRIYLRERPTKDWMDDLTTEYERIDRLEERIREQEKELREEARKKGRKKAMKLVRKVDPVFAPRKLNPDDAKVIFHPVDYVVFNGMKRLTAVKDILLLDQQTKSRDRRSLQSSIKRTINKGRYEWLTLRIDEAGAVQEE
jgi:predicted Holliday junction resolvase-like endonuclease